MTWAQFAVAGPRYFDPAQVLRDAQQASKATVNKPRVEGGIGRTQTLPICPPRTNK